MLLIIYRACRRLLNAVKSEANRRSNVLDSKPVCLSPNRPREVKRDIRTNPTRIRENDDHHHRDAPPAVSPTQLVPPSLFSSISICLPHLYWDTARFSTERLTPKSLYIPCNKSIAHRSYITGRPEEVMIPCAYGNDSALVFFSPQRVVGLQLLVCLLCERRENLISRTGKKRKEKRCYLYFLEEC